MGFYINPPDRTKEHFLQDNGRRISEEDAGYMATHVATLSEAPVCHDEFRAMSRPDDSRPKAWFAVPKTALQPYCKNYY